MELEGPSNGREESFSQIPLPSKRQHTREPLAVPKDLLEVWHEATVSSLSLLPVACVEPNATVRMALAASRAHRGQCVLIAEQGCLRGYVDLIDLVSHETQGSLDDLVQDIQHHFVPLSDGTFRVIHAGTRLAEVAVFLESAPLALVSDEAGTHITNVVERGDLIRYAESSGMHASGGMEEETSMPNRNDEESRRDRSLVDVLRRLDGYAPLIPDEVTYYYLERAGFQCEDVRLKRLLALATEKFVADIASDAFQYARIRTNAGPARSSRPTRDRARTLLTMDDLSAALGEYGIDARRAETFR